MFVEISQHKSVIACCLETRKFTSKKFIYPFFFVNKQFRLFLGKESIKKINNFHVVKNSKACIQIQILFVARFKSSFWKTNDFKINRLWSLEF